MSARAIGWAFAVQEFRSERGDPLRPVCHHVLLCLADRYNPAQDGAWPSYPDIVKRTGLSERAVRNAIMDLERLGLIQRIPRLSANGRKIGLFYRFPTYDDAWASERTGYDMNATSGRYDPERAAENANDAELPDRYDVTFP